MDLRRFGHETRRNHIRDVGRFATFLGRSPDTATAQEVRCFPIERCDLDVSAPTMNAIVAALRFFSAQTFDRPGLACKRVRMRHGRKLPVVLSQDEVARRLAATTCLTHQVALSVAHGAGCARPRSPRSATSASNTFKPVVGHGVGRRAFALSPVRPNASRDQF